MKPTPLDIRTCELSEVERLCAAHHAYGGAGGTAVYCFGVYEDGALVAAFSWQPPPPGAALSTCREVPGGVLALSRMVAVPKDQRALRHISKPLRVIMRRLIDRTRWPVLITYSDESKGHTGHVYKCSGWQPTIKRKSAAYEDDDGRRVSVYSNGKQRPKALKRAGSKVTQRWEHWASTTPLADMTAAGWHRVPVEGKSWRSGAQAYKWEQTTP